MTWPQVNYGSTSAHGGLGNSLLSEGHLYLVNIPMCAMNLCLRIIWVLHFPYDPLG